MAKLQHVIDRLDRIEDLLRRLLPEPGESAAPCGLTRALHAATGGDWFVSGEAWALAMAEASAASASGDTMPFLPAELGRAGIGSTHALGRWLAAREGRGVERAPAERSGTRWRVCGFDGFGNR